MPTPTPLPLDPPIQRVATGQYSYGDTATNCTGIDVNIVDPISVVVHIDQHAAAVLNTSAYVEDHIGHHGWNLGSSANQYFHNGLGLPPPPEECVIGVISLADGDDTTSRNHTRGHTQDEVVAWGYGGPWTMTALTPHYDQRISTTCWHAVPENLNPPGYDEYSGYSAARDTLISHWLLDAGAQHRYVIQASFWGNRQRVPQCNAPDGDPAQWRPRSDGWVYFLGVCEVHSAVATPC